MTRYGPRRRRSWRRRLAIVVCAAGCGGAGGGGAATPLTSEFVVGGLDQPLFVTAAPGDESRLFVVEQAGRIRIVDLTAEPPALVATAFLDITDRVINDANERGLLGLAFHPDFQNNRWFYVDYTGAGGTTFVSRFSVPAETPQLADATSEQMLLTLAQPQGNHNGGWLGFGPLDGMLYIATGDGGGGGDDDAGHTPGVGNSQDITSNLLGKLLRIDVDAGGGAYGIPADNPFVGAPGDDEIWAYGLRNPWRNAFDRVTGDLYIADVGSRAGRRSTSSRLRASAARTGAGAAARGRTRSIRARAAPPPHRSTRSTSMRAGAPHSAARSRGARCTAAARSPICRAAISWRISARARSGA